MTPEQAGATVLEEPLTEVSGAESERDETEPIEADLLIEDVSIDGMCGVY